MDRGRRGNTLALAQQLSRSAYRQLSAATTVDMKELITLSHLRETALTEQQRQQLHDLLHLTLHGEGGVLQRLRGAAPTAA